MDQTDLQPDQKRPRLPWLEIALLAGLLILAFISVNAIFGDDIRAGIDDYCTAQGLWCAPPTPTPTITPTPTPTQTPTPLTTLTPTP